MIEETLNSQGDTCTNVIAGLLYVKHKLLLQFIVSPAVCVHVDAALYVQ